MKRWWMVGALALSGCAGMVLESVDGAASDGAGPDLAHDVDLGAGDRFASDDANALEDFAAANDDLALQQNSDLAGAICPGAGSYCGGDGIAGDPSTLFLCGAAGQAPASSVVCMSGCAAAGGGADACNVAMPMGGGAVCPGAGAWCGSDMVQNGVADTLYQCPGKGLAPSSSEACANGCDVEPMPTPDFCKPSLACATAGDYCGGDNLGGDPNTLYHCAAKGQAPASSMACGTGCQVNPQGQNDTCRGGLACPGPGAYCGADGVQGGDANTLYNCPGAGQPPMSSTACAHGCTIEPQGTPDLCAVNLVCPGPGDYCGNDGVGGSPSVLYHCGAKGQAPASSTGCASGCAVMKPGVPDLCIAAGCSGLGAAALSWEANQLNTGHPWSSLCLGFVNNAFAAAGNSPAYLHLGTANASLTAARATGHFVAWGGSCPCGAILYWASNNCNQEDGHVVICNGDGTASTSGWTKFNGATHASIAWLDGEECGHTPAGYILP